MLAAHRRFSSRVATTPYFKVQIACPITWYTTTANSRQHSHPTTRVNHTSRDAEFGISILNFGSKLATIRVNPGTREYSAYKG